ncbi:MAG: ABC transporter permease [Chloroflexi bacterium]|nr:ABC transporter permease [Chloroflexota bacterium]MBU1750941.1 ABC transporter permease [Chloroflexota bacterium]MBU1878009.1 ABC transporter permease [Chloroflexota bacterium]
MTTNTQARSDERVVRIGLIRGLFRRVEIGAIIGAVVVWCLFAAVAPENWISVTGVARILDPASTLGIMAIGVALLMIGGEFDLSTGVMTGTTGLVAGLLATRLGVNLWVAMLAALVFALAVGYINGVMVNRTGLPSFIVTLATFFVLRGANVGVTRMVTEQVYVGGIDKAEGFELARAFFNTGIDIFGIEFRSAIIWWVVIALIATWILLRTKYGSWIFATGGDANAARNVGVPANRVKVALFMTTAGCAWLVGMMNIVRLRSAVASQGIGQEFVYIIAATIGGCLLTGGYGSVIGASIGAVIFGMAQVGIVFAGWDTDWFYSFLGIMLLAAVLVNNYTRRHAEQISVAAAKARTEGE